MFFFDPRSGNVSYNEFNKLFSEFNVAINNDTIRENDKSMHLANSQHMLWSQTSNPRLLTITWDRYLQDACSAQRSVEILKNVKEYIEVTSLVSTSDEAESLSTESEDKNKTGEF